MSNEERCVSCGAVIPEGRQVCPACHYQQHKQQNNAEQASAKTSEIKELSQKAAAAVRSFAEALTEAAKLAAEAIKAAQELKILPNYFEAVLSGRKPFEVRSTKDRTFEEDGFLKLREYDGKDYTGRWLLVRITYVLAGGQYGIDPDFAVLGIQRIGAVQNDKTEVQTDEKLHARKPKA